MDKIKSIKKLLLLIPAVLLLVFNSCKHEDLEIVKENENFRLAADFIKNNYDMTLFSAALEKTGMRAQLQGAGPFTILVPNDVAFQQIGINRPSDFDKMDPDSLKSLVQRHILNERLLFSDIPVNGVDIRYRTLAGTEVYTSLASYAPGNNAYPSNDLYFNGSSVTRKDVTIANGIIHVLNKVMKYTPESTVQDWLAKRPQYSIFVSGLKKFGLWNKLATEGPYTVFAPQNKVFEANQITEASIAGLKTGDYIGERLFGAYIFDNRHFFISDFAVFNLINREFNFLRKVDNDDSWYVLVNSSVDFYTRAVTCNMNIRTALVYPYTDYTKVNSLIPALTDNLTDNGLVHDVQGLLVLPQQALKNDIPKD